MDGPSSHSFAALGRQEGFADISIENDPRTDFVVGDSSLENEPSYVTLREPHSLGGGWDIESFRVSARFAVGRIDGGTSGHSSPHGPVPRWWSVGALRDDPLCSVVAAEYHSYVANYQGVLSALSLPVTFRCAKCVRAGIAAPSALAVVGDPGSDVDTSEFGGTPVVFIRAKRIPKIESALQHQDCDPTVDDDFLAMTRLFPKASRQIVTVDALDELEPTKTITAKTFRVPFVALIEDVSRVMVQCPHGHRVQVTRRELIRRAAQATASGDESPTI